MRHRQGPQPAKSTKEDSKTEAPHGCPGHPVDTLVSMPKREKESRHPNAFPLGPYQALQTGDEVSSKEELLAEPNSQTRDAGQRKLDNSARPSELIICDWKNRGQGL